MKKIILRCVMFSVLLIVNNAIFSNADFSMDNVFKAALGLNAWDIVAALEPHVSKEAKKGNSYKNALKNEGLTQARQKIQSAQSESCQPLTDKQVEELTKKLALPKAASTAKDKRELAKSLEQLFVDGAGQLTLQHLGASESDIKKVQSALAEALKPAKQ